MAYSIDETPWSGRRRFFLTVTTTIFFFSLCTLILSIISVALLYNEGLTAQDYPYYKPIRRPAAWYFFYAPFYPLVCTIHSGFETALHRTNRLNAIYSFTASATLFLAWGVQLWAWYFCDMFALDVGGCPMVDESTYSQNEAEPIVAFTKLAFGHLVLTGYSFYTACTAYALGKHLMLRRMARVGKRERCLDSLELDEMPSGGKQAEQTQDV